jgi:hypothetical protein
MAATIGAFPLSQRRPARSVCLRWDLIFATSARPTRALPDHCGLKLNGILTSGRPIRNRKLTRVNAKSLSSKESIMLDVAFVVLGLAVLALMGAYAVGLRQL